VLLAVRFLCKKLWKRHEEKIKENRKGRKIGKKKNEGSFCMLLLLLLVGLALFPKKK
jgi:hypothetical protein